MDIRRIFAVCAAAAMICGAAVSCNEKVKTSKNVESSTNKNTALADLSDVQFEDTVTAGTGDAYLAIADKDFRMQYLGGSDENNQLTFDAGVVHIDGNGDYKVSVNADTKGFRYRATGDPDKEYKPKGLEYAAVIIEDGETAVPNAVITIKKVKVDGKDVELKKKSFTYTDAGKLRSNIFNEWISDDGLPDDSRCDKGSLFNNFDNASPSDINDGSFSAQLVDTSAFDEWTKVEVEFSVSGLDK